MTRSEKSFGINGTKFTFIRQILSDVADTNLKTVNQAGC